MNRKDLIVAAFGHTKLHPALDLIWRAFWSSTRTTNEMEAVITRTAEELGEEYAEERDFCTALLAAVQAKLEHKDTLKPKWFIRTVLRITQWTKVHKIELEVENYFASEEEPAVRLRIVVRSSGGNAFSNLNQRFPFNLL